MHSLRRFCLGIGRTCPSLDACINGRRFIPHVSRSCLHEFQQQSRRRCSVPAPTARTAVMRLCSAKTDHPHAWVNQSDRRHVEVRRREELGGRQRLRLHRRRCSYTFSVLCLCHRLSIRSHPLFRPRRRQRRPVLPRIFPTRVPAPGQRGQGPFRRGVRRSQRQDASSERLSGGRRRWRRRGLWL